jgi:DNA modification methylase
MKTLQRVYFEDSRRMPAVPAAGVDLVVTSPPYPMIEMWDGLFRSQKPGIGAALDARDGRKAFELMHRELDAVWSEVHRTLTPGGIACVNIGDAVRSINDDFMLYPNQARVLSRLLELGFTPLPAILWRKPTNSPTKFMGSGMLPAGAYVTLEHEYIIVVRKGGKREFATAAEKQVRRESAMFWEERNAWFSDVWMELRGARQALDDRAARRRSGAFPFELAYRLVSMFSVRGDTVLDPFLGTGTTLTAAAAAGRNGIGFEIDPGFRPAVFAAAPALAQAANERIRRRLADHVDFLEQCRQTGRALKHINRPYGFPVVTRQETELVLNPVVSVARCDPDAVEVRYDDAPPAAFDLDPGPGPGAPAETGSQRSLFG